MKPAFLLAASLACIPTLAPASADTPWIVTSTAQTPLVPPAQLSESSPPIVVTPAGDLYLGGIQLGGQTKSVGDTSVASTYVSKASATGAPAFAVKLGGSYEVNAMAVDPNGNLLVAGLAAPAGLPVTAGAYRASGSGNYPAYVCKLKSSDGSPLFCTYLNGAPTALTAIAVDPAGNIYVLTTAPAGAVPTTPGALALGDREVQVTKLDPTGSKLLYTAEIGGSNTDHPTSLLADAGGNVYVTGVTWSPDFPGTAGGAIPTLEASNGLPFLAKLNPTGTAIIYATYGHANETAIAIALDAAGEVLMLLGPSVRKFAGDGKSIVFDEQLPAGVQGSSIALDESGVISITGNGNLGAAIDHNTSVCGSGFLIRLNPAGTILQATNLPLGVTIAANSNGGFGVANSNVQFQTQFVLFQLAPEQSPAQETPIACFVNAADFESGPLAPGEIFSIFGTGLGPAVALTSELDSNGRISSSLAGVQVTFDGLPAPLLYVQEHQINAIAPWALAGKSTTQLCTSYAGRTNCTTAAVTAASPAAFAVAPGYAAAINRDGAINSPQNPAAAGSIVSLYLTGLGLIAPTPADGEIVKAPLPLLANQVRAFTNGSFDPHAPLQNLVPLEVLYAGPAPFEAGGVYQINVRVPTGAIWITVQSPDDIIFNAPAISVSVK